MTSAGGEEGAGEEVPLDQAPQAVRGAPEEGDEQAGRSSDQQQTPQEEEVEPTTQELEIVGRHTSPPPAPGRAWHPDDTVLWDIYTQTRPDGTVAVICAHCGELRPCDELIRRHMATDLHQICVQVGRCYYAGRALNELPRP